MCTLSFLISIFILSAAGSAVGEQQFLISREDHTNGLMVRGHSVAPSIDTRDIGSNLSLHKRGNFAKRSCSGKESGRHPEMPSRQSFSGTVSSTNPTRSTAREKNFDNEGDTLLSQSNISPVHKSSDSIGVGSIGSKRQSKYDPQDSEQSSAALAKRGGCFSTSRRLEDASGTLRMPPIPPSPGHGERRTTDSIRIGIPPISRLHSQEMARLIPSNVPSERPVAEIISPTPRGRSPDSRRKSL